MKQRTIFGTIALLIIGLVFGVVLVSSFGWVKPSMAEIQIGSKNPPVSPITTDAKSFNEAFVDVAQKVTPSIVQITVVSKVKGNPHDAFQFFFPFNDKNMPRKQAASGSGIIISDDGYILTNNHVVKNAITVEVTLNDKREFKAKVIGTDPLTDLGVIKIDAKDLPAAYLGNSDKLKVGTWVMAIGNPLSLTSTVTAGIVSATNRSLRLIKDSYGVEDFIQTDAAINPGNSGGALVDLNGAVVGINSAIATNGMSGTYIGYGFAIPINLAKSVAQDLIANGKVSRGYIGVQISEVDAATAKAVGLAKPTGVMIQNIVKDGSAASADIKAGDIILKIDNKVVNQPNELQGYVATKRAGDEVTLTLFRNGDTIERTVKLKSRNSAGDETVVNNDKKEEKKDNEGLEEITFKDLGLSVKDMNKSQLKKFDAENGILITGVKEFSPAANQRLRPGYIIIEANNNKVESAKDFEKIIDKKKGKAILLKIKADKENTFFVGLEIPK
ncbi:putative periplasmic serine endoprotease DegP-like precursor [bacterium BMS3Abin04]|nr:putative periplasmic serine endoprotease DegP-like precursor [bacterium BMS3Abin04]